MWPFKKQRTLAKTVWLTTEGIRADKFQSVLETVPGKKLITAEFITSLAARRNDLEKAFWRIAVFNLALLAILFLNSSLFPEMLIFGLKN